MQESITQMIILNYTLHMTEWESAYAIQIGIDRAFMTEIGVTSIPEFDLIQLNTWSYSQEKLFYTHKDSLLAAFITISVIYGFAGILKTRPLKKGDCGLEEMIRIVGALPKFVHWLSCFISNIAYLLISFSLITTALCFDEMYGISLIKRSSAFIVWLLLMCYLISIVTFAIFISSFLKTKLSGLIIFILTTIPHFKLKEDFVNMNVFFKITICMLGNSGLSQGIRTILYYEKESKTGLQLDDFFSSDNFDNFSIAINIFSLLLGSIISALMTIYIEELFIGDESLAKNTLLF